MKRLNYNILVNLRNEKQNEAIKLLYQYVFPTVRSFIIKNSGNKEQAEDIFHDAIIILFQKSKEFNHNAIDVKAYLYTIAKNLWISKARRDAKVVYNEILHEYDSSYDSDIEKHLLTQEKELAMEAILNKLGTACKELLKLTFYEDYSLKEAAEKLNISNAEVAKTKQYRCKKKLMTLINKNEGFKQLMNIR